MVNSTWTAEHIRRLWWRLEPPARVFPPCDVADLAGLPLDRKLKRLYLVSLAQFRPEKDHALQLRAFARARRRAAAGAGHAADAARRPPAPLQGAPLVVSVVCGWRGLSCPFPVNGAAGAAAIPPLPLPPPKTPASLASKARPPEGL
jgi:hypothetical protein